MLWQPGMLHRYSFLFFGTHLEWHTLKRRSNLKRISKMNAGNADSDCRSSLQNEFRGVAGGDMGIDKTRGYEWLRWAMLLAVLAWTASGVAQESASGTQVSSPRPVPQSSNESSSSRESSSSESVSDSVSDAVRELREQVRELQTAVAGMRSDWQRARAETAELRRELDEIRAGEVRVGTAQRTAMLKDAVEKSATGISESAGNLQNALQNDVPLEEKGDQKQEQKKGDRAASLDEEYQLLSGKVDDQYQTKVESASKYRLRLSGIVLMNLVSNQGTVDSIDIPTLALPRPVGDSGGSFAATLRQSQIGFETFGPNVAGAKTRADLQIDFAGGFPVVPNGVNSGLLRLRTATMRMDWTNTSVVVGQDGLFFSPNSPTSFASLAVPALTNAGNLWSWVPQIRVEHRVALGDESSLVLQAGILDPVSGEIPGAIPGTTGVAYYRQAGPGESSRQP